MVVSTHIPFRRACTSQNAFMILGYFHFAECTGCFQNGNLRAIIGFYLKDLSTVGGRKQGFGQPEGYKLGNRTFSVFLGPRKNACQFAIRVYEYMSHCWKILIRRTMLWFVQIFHSQNLGLNSKVMTKKWFWSQNNFFATTFEPIVQLVPNFEWGKICQVGY